MVAQLVLPNNITVAPHAPLSYTPKFWDPRKAYVNYEPDVEGALLEGWEYRQAHPGLKTAMQLESEGTSNAIMLTDLQHDFMEWGRLPVQGASNVVLRAMVRFLNGLFTPYYTRVIYSQDGHVPFHISYGSTWQHMQTRKLLDLREHKAAVLELVDRQRAVFRATAFALDGSPVDLGEVRSIIEAKDTVAYWDYLQGDPAKPETQQGPIWIFANHCKLGTDGTNLHPLIAEALAFAEGARLLAPTPVNKGHIRKTDWFGPLEPCRPDPSHPQGSFQKPTFDYLVGVTGNIEFFGVAEDFCDFNMKRQVLAHLQDNDVFRRIAFATDGTAPIVPNAPHVLQQNADARAKGIRFFTHDESLAAV